MSASLFRAAIPRSADEVASIAMPLGVDHAVESVDVEREMLNLVARLVGGDPFHLITGELEKRREEKDNF